MKEELKDLIDNAPIVEEGLFKHFLIVPSDTVYDGFWGKNGYDNIIVLGEFADDSAEQGYKGYGRIDQYSGSDAFHITSILNANIDIPSEFGCVRLWFNEPISVSYPASSICGYGKSFFEKLSKKC